MCEVFCSDFCYDILHSAMCACAQVCGGGHLRDEQLGRVPPHHRARARPGECACAWLTSPARWSASAQTRPLRL